MKQATQAVPEARTMAPRDLLELEAVLRDGRTLYVVISAKLAEAALAAWNIGNRRYDEVTAQRYRRDMEAGRWLADGEIGFGVFAGEPVQLGDGQHRLGAQVSSGTSQRYNARVFTDHDEFAVFVLTCGGGRPRTLADQLKIFDVAETSGAAQAFERVVNAMHGFMGAKASRLSTQERMDFAYAYVKPIKYAMTLPKRAFKAHLLAAIALAHSRRGKATEDFVAQVISGAELAYGSPALELSKALPDMNDARDAKSKDKAMGRMLRVLFDATNGKHSTAIVGAKASGAPMLRAISALVSADAANAWVARQEQAAK